MTDHRAEPAPARRDDYDHLRHDDVRDDRHIVADRPTLRDRIRWGPVFAGLVVAIATYILLQLALVATGIVDVGQLTATDAWASAGAAFVAFTLGGVTAGATAQWTGADDGIIHGVVLWAVSLVALIALSALGSGAVLGSIDVNESFDEIFTEEGAITTEEIDLAGASDNTREGASWALLALTAALAAATAGGALGAKMWPRHDAVVNVTERA